MTPPAALVVADEPPVAQPAAAPPSACSRSRSTGSSRADTPGGSRTATPTRAPRILRLGTDAVDEVFALGAERALTVVSGPRLLTLESLAGYPLVQVRTLPREPHVLLEAMTAAPDALSRDDFPVVTPGRPYRAALRLGLDER